MTNTSIQSLERNKVASRFEVYALRLLPRIRPFDLYEAIIKTNFRFKQNDIVIVSSKFVSISEGAVVQIGKIRV
ncbi:MAG: hypothetical protein WBP83_14580, partial [Nitrososphaeraceae archaeon]